MPTSYNDLIGVVEPAFAETISARLDAIEVRLAEQARGDNPFVSQVAGHVVAAGGKRFRPLLVALAASLGDGADPSRVERAAVVVELTHVASLYHDDVMDEAQLRRGADSVNARWGNSVAILVGDLLFARASSVVTTLGLEFVELQARTFARLVHGQVAETIGPGESDDPLEHYLAVVADKTGSLIATSAVFGGMVAGLDDASLAALGRFGEAIGTVFQLSDDLIDIASNTSGKTPGTDLRAKVPTLPTLYVRRSTHPADARLLALLDGDLSDDADLAEALRLLRAHPAMDDARAEISRRAELARSYLGPLPVGQARDALSALCDAVIDRSA